MRAHTHHRGEANTHPHKTFFLKNTIFKLKKKIKDSRETTFESLVKSPSVSEAHFFPQVKMNSFSVKGWEKLGDVTEGQN